MPNSVPFTPAEFLTPLGFVTLPIRGAAAAAMSAFSGDKSQAQTTAKDGQKATLGNKPVVFNGRTNKWEPDLSTPQGKDAWRPAGTTATLGRRPVRWDPKQGWVQVDSGADSSAPPPPPPTEGEGTANYSGASGEAPLPPELPAPTAQPPGTYPSTGGPLTTQKPDLDPELPFKYAEKFLSDYFPKLREAEQARELERSIVTAQLRNQGLQELSRRAIETKTIEAWQRIAEARLQAQSNQAIALANTAYLSQIPHTGIMEAMATTMKASMQPVSISSVGAVG